MSEIVERVAESLRASMPGLVNPEAWPWETLARAAIEAMREPTQEIINAGSDYMPGAGYSEGAWRAMIDECLR